ncbi:hypothetical protein [Streptomyces decoyicus]|uniref:hypothetical protein n=1 Tax=Streptomyces decoyicus TaxID=249567 RepID=UPI0012373241|nr:hypothetical protein [Streptomyces decoyicus]QZY20234.1 hypothetical protein K7C20_37765 [Streptomyces decoyicus]
MTEKINCVESVNYLKLWRTQLLAKSAQFEKGCVPISPMGTPIEGGLRMKIFSRNRVWSAAVGGALLVAASATAAYAGGSTSTSPSNGKLSFEAHNGREIGQSSSKIYTGEKYSKSGGSAVSAQLKVSFAGALYKGPVKTVSAGKSISYSVTAPVSVASDCSAVGVMGSNGVNYETPYIDHLC